MTKMLRPPPSHLQIVPQSNQSCYWEDMPAVQSKLSAIILLPFPCYPEQFLPTHVFNLSEIFVDSNHISLSHCLAKLYAFWASFFSHVNLFRHLTIFLYFPVKSSASAEAITRITAGWAWEPTARLTQMVSLVACVWLELHYEVSVLAAQRGKVQGLLKVNAHILTGCSMAWFNHSA